MQANSSPNGAPMNPHLSWTCQACGKHIDNGAGYIHVDLAAVGRHERAWAEFNKQHTSDAGFLSYSLAEMRGLPELVAWEAHHRACDPRLDDGDYWFDVGQARTHAALLSWTSHLMVKNWIDDTDWSEFIARVAGVRV